MMKLNSLQLNSLMILLIYSVILAVKDFGFKFLLLQNFSIYQVLGCSGIFMLIFLFIGNVIPRVHWGMAPSWPLSPWLQLARVLLSGFSFFCIVKALSLMSATTFGISSKIFVPLMIVFAGILGKEKYTQIQRRIALVSIVFLCAFSILGRDARDQALGFLFVGLSIVSVVIEYSLLRRSAIEDSNFWTSFPPAISLLAMGLVGTMLFPSQISLVEILSVQNLAVLTSAAGCLFLVFFLSKIKYKLLPLGFSEYPSLFSVFIILALESSLLHWQPDYLYLVTISVVTILIGLAASWDQLSKRFHLVNGFIDKKELT